MLRRRTLHPSGDRARRRRRSRRLQHRRILLWLYCSGRPPVEVPPGAAIATSPGPDALGSLTWLSTPCACPFSTGVFWPWGGQSALAGDVLSAARVRSLAWFLQWGQPRAVRESATHPWLHPEYSPLPEACTRYYPVRKFMLRNRRWHLSRRWVSQFLPACVVFRLDGE